jgi:hypothetical protein
MSFATIAEDIQTIPKDLFQMKLMMFMKHVKCDAGAAGARRTLESGDGMTNLLSNLKLGISDLTPRSFFIPPNFASPAIPPPSLLLM